VPVSIYLLSVKPVGAKCNQSSPSKRLRVVRSAFHNLSLLVGNHCSCVSHIFLSNYRHLKRRCAFSGLTRARARAASQTCPSLELTVGVRIRNKASIRDRSVLQNAHLLAVILPRRALRVICAQVAAILHLCNVEETVREHHVVRQQLLRLETTLWMTVALALTRLRTCRCTLEIAARIFHVLTVMHNLDKVVHVCARFLVWVDTLHLAHHCFLPARFAGAVVLRVRAIDAGEVLSIRLAGLEFLL